MLSNLQLQMLKTFINQNPTWAAMPLSMGTSQVIADELNVLVAPVFWGWRTNVSRADIYHSTSPDNTTWDWTVYKNQTQGEQGAWTQMFMGDVANFALPNLRNGVATIFSGAGAPAAQRAHILAVGRRAITVGEKVFAVGAGTTATPATMSFEGNLTASDVMQARELP